jgi:hypothetical protein
MEGAAITAADIGVSHPLVGTIGLFLARLADRVVCKKTLPWVLIGR